ncbi:unnamed protein product, partial [Natator depressus]
MEPVGRPGVPPRVGIRDSRKGHPPDPHYYSAHTRERPSASKTVSNKREAREGLQETIDQLLMYGILQECQSAWNTPILSVQKPDGTYQLVQDLRAVNEWVKTLHPLVPNPYTLLASIGGQYTHFSVLDLKNAFFTIPVATPSQEIFSFEWEDRKRVKKQLCWTVLAQGFKNSPTLFGQ